jgi:mono/diheme cytochrome c family protein
MLHNKTLLYVTLCLMVGILLAGCGNQAAAEPTATQAHPTEPPVSSPQGAATETSAPTPTDVPTDVPTERPTEGPAEAPAAGAVTVSFANDVLPIIESRCVNCHGGDRIEEGLVMLSYNDLLAGSENGPVIVPGDPANSLLVELVTSQKMPKRGPKLTPPQVQIITEWVAAGAPNN